jgi:SNF2 family DNA or RNA helicase
VELLLIADRRKIPVQIERSGRKLAIRSPYNRTLVTEFKCMKGSEWDAKTKRWKVTDCRRNWMQLECLQGIRPIEFERYLSDAPGHLVSTSARNLYEHQHRMFEFALERRGVIWAAEMGTGKTLAAIELMEDIGGQWMWCAPAKVLAAIELELDKWDAKVRPDLISYARLRRRLEKWEGSAPVGVIFDESSRLKSPGAQRTKAAMHLANAVREENDGYVVCMTGSPAPKDPCDWWSQVEIVCPGWLRESKITALRDRLAIIETMEVNGAAFPKIVDWKEDEVRNLKRRLEPVVCIVRSSECQDLPEIIYERVEIPPSKQLLRRAKVVAAQAMTAVEALSEVRQLSDGFSYKEEQCAVSGVTDDAEAATSASNATSGNTSDWLTQSPKAKALRTLLGRYEEAGRLIVYGGFKRSIDVISDVCRDEGWTVIQCDGRGWKTPKGETTESLLREMDRKTNTGRIEKLAFVAHPASGGMGLTLTAAPAAIYFSNDFSFESRTQSEKRGHRAGMDTRRGFRIFDLIHLPTDTLILKNLEKKQVLQELTLTDVMEALA